MPDFSLSIHKLEPLFTFCLLCIELEKTVTFLEVPSTPGYASHDQCSQAIMQTATHELYKSH